MLPTNNRLTPNAVLHCRRRRPRRLGSLYLSVAGVAAIVSAIGMSAMVVARLNLRSVSGMEDRREARLLADAAIEFGTAIVVQDPNWRTSFQNEAPYPSSPMAFGNGTIQFKLVDTDNDLDNNDTDGVRLYGIGTVGDSVYTKSVWLEPTDGLDCLTSALHAHQSISINGGSTVVTATGGPVSTNNQLSNAGTIDGDVECDGASPAGTITGTLTDPLDPDKTLPGPDVFDYYLSKGTWIDIDDIPDEGIDRMLLSDTYNPFGSGITNSEGIYVIDCEGDDLIIKDSRLQATLVILNPGIGTRIEKDIHWEAAVANYPALMVYGDIEFKWHGNHNLRETQLGVNFNPDHTPYQGDSDTDQLDEYPPVIKGIIFVSGNLNVTDECILEGVTVVGGAVNGDDNITLTYDSIYLDNPPPGFRTSGSTSNGGTNVLSNPGFESGTTGWSSWVSFDRVDTGDFVSGAQSMEIYGIFLPDPAAYQHISGVENGVTYDLEAWVKVNSGTAEIELGMSTTGSTSGQQVFDAPAVTVGTTWTKVTGQVTVNWTGTLNDATFHVRNDSNYTSFKIDDVSCIPQGGSSTSDPVMQLVPCTWQREVSQ